MQCPWSNAETRPQWLRSDFVVACVAALTGTGLQGVLAPLLGPQGAYLPCIAMVAVVTARAGVRAGIFTALLGVGSVTLLFVRAPGRSLLEAPTGLRMAAALLICAAIIAALRAVDRRMRRLVQDCDKLTLERDRQERFLAFASHELRSPLNAASCAVAMLQAAGSDAAVAARSVGTLQRQLKQLGRIAEDLVASSASALGRLSIERRDIDLRTCVEAAVEMYGSHLRVRQQSLHIELPAAAVIVRADAGRMTQAIGNVLHNASKFSPPGSAIVVRMGALGAWVEVTVQDAGPGFGRGDPACHGLGIGLQLCQMFLELQDGFLRIDDAPGGGAIVRLRLPRAGSPGNEAVCKAPALSDAVEVVALRERGAAHGA